MCSALESLQTISLKRQRAPYFSWWFWVSLSLLSLCDIFLVAQIFWPLFLSIIFSVRFLGVKVSKMISYVWKAYFLYIKRLYALNLWLYYNYFETLVFSLSTKEFQNSTQYSNIYTINKDKIIFLILHTTSHFIQAWIIVSISQYLPVFPL